MKRIIVLCLAFIFTLIPLGETEALSAATETTSLNEKVTAYQQDLTKPGEYRILLIFEEDGIRLEKIITITVKDEQHHKTYSVRANDGRLSISQARRFDMLDWITWAGIEIYNQTDGYAETISYVNTEHIEYVPGSYEVFFGNDHVGGSFIVTLFSEGAMPPLPSAEESTNVQAETTTNNLDDQSLQHLFAKNMEYVNTESYLELLDSEEKHTLQILSWFIIFCFLCALIFLYIQFIISRNALKNIMTFFEQK